ncbi:MAG: M28 family peptidase, partial [Planctomycetota bacterium]|nr:M28 family peptidase [Planctomycetota bacterium]
MKSRLENRTFQVLPALVACIAIQGVVEAGESDPSKRYAGVADRIIRECLAENDAWKKMEELCDGIGHRLSGSEALDKAIAWAVKSMKADGHENVRTEKVMVPKWVRGRESLHMVKPRDYALAMIGLGRSVGTPAEGLTASVVVVRDEEDLERKKGRVKGKIVLFNNPMPPYDAETGAGYGRTVRFRSDGPSMVAKLGGVACLVRSVTAHSLRSPHTGATRYEEGTAKIPAAAVSTEDAEMMARLTARGREVVVTLKMEARSEGDVPSANVLAEVRGSEKPEEIVVIGGHLDSWDTGTGAHDDGAGCVIAMEALNVLRRLELTPRRTIRVV